MKTIPSLLLFLLILDCSGTRPQDIGVRQGRFKPCPDKPNCVNSQSEPSDKIHYIDPVSYTLPLLDEQKRIKDRVLSLPRTDLVQSETGYMHFEFTSMLMRYKDDVEFYLDDSVKLIHIRSASRLGTSDMGVNRKRMEEIRSLLKK